MDDKLFKQEGYDLMAAAFEVYNTMGSGFLEEVYQECIERELTSRGTPWCPKPTLLVFYKGMPLIRHYVPDLLVWAEIVVELKAAKCLAPEHEAQLFNYLKATRTRVGYLVNFGSFPGVQWKRIVVDHDDEHRPAKVVPQLVSD